MPATVQLPILETDVLVAGAGTAGCIAAIAAARQGASVILIEKLPVSGGVLHEQKIVLQENFLIYSAGCSSGAGCHFGVKQMKIVE